MNTGTGISSIDVKRLRDENHILLRTLDRLQKATEKSSENTERLRKKCRELSTVNEELNERIYHLQSKIEVLQTRLAEKEAITSKVSQAVKNAVREFSQLREKYEHQCRARSRVERKLAWALVQLERAKKGAVVEEMPHISATSAEASETENTSRSSKSNPISMISPMLAADPQKLRELFAKLEKDLHIYK